MIKSVTAKEMQSYNKYAIEKIGISSSVLIERSAMAIIDIIGSQNFDLSNILIISGLGINGSNGIATARILKQKGFSVDILLVGDKKRASKEVINQLNIANHFNLFSKNKIFNFKKYSLIIDSLFGITLSKPVPIKIGEIIKNVNLSKTTVLSIDVPSGLNATTGQVMGASIKANTTVTFAYMKTGLVTEESKYYTGKVFVKDIGVYATEYFTI